MCLLLFKMLFDLLANESGQEITLREIELTRHKMDVCVRLLPLIVMMESFGIQLLCQEIVL